MDEKLIERMYDNHFSGKMDKNEVLSAVFKIGSAKMKEIIKKTCSPKTIVVLGAFSDEPAVAKIAIERVQCYSTECMINLYETIVSMIANTGALFNDLQKLKKAIDERRPVATQSLSS